MDSGGAKSFTYTELHKQRAEQRHESEAKFGVFTRIGLIHSWSRGGSVGGAVRERCRVGSLLIIVISLESAKIEGKRRREWQKMT